FHVYAPSHSIHDRSAEIVTSRSTSVLERRPSRTLADVVAWAALHCLTAAEPTAGAGQSQTTDRKGEEPQHHRPPATDDSVAATRTTFGDGQHQAAADGRDETGHEGHDSPQPPGGGTQTTVGARQRQPTRDHAAERQRGDRGCP